MRRVLPLLLIATPALADSEKLVLRPLEARALPHVAASDADCDAGVDFTPIAVTQKLGVRGPDRAGAGPALRDGDRGLRWRPLRRAGARSRPADDEQWGASRASRDRLVPWIRGS